MSEHTEVKYDKNNWARGEWDLEPDRLQFNSHGFACLIVRNSTGNLCGYVGVPNNHPAYGKEEDHYDVHGGITYSGKCSSNICHVPEPGFPDDVWWLGFDTAHYGDISPSLLRFAPLLYKGTEETYKNIEYVIVECHKLAQQLREEVK